MSQNNDESAVPESRSAAARSRLDSLARRYAGPLAAYFKRKTPFEDDVPDLVQEVLTRLARLRDFSTIEKPENYIFRTAANMLRERARYDGYRHRAGHVEFDADLHSASDFSPERIYAGREAVKAMQLAIRALPERTRDVFVLRVLEEQKTAEVARALGMSTRAVEKRQADALALIAAALKDHRK